MSFSIVLRRIHMYFALFLTPWILMYALAVIGVNHRDFFMTSVPPGSQFELEMERVYTAAFSSDAEPELIAGQILADLDLEGTNVVRHNKEQGSYTIIRSNPITPRRITYTPAEEKLVVEKRLLGTVGILADLHHRAGYRSEQVMSDVWAFFVDLNIIGMIIWVLSGIWIWWKIWMTRRWGLISILIGCGLFGFFLITI